ncbi:hypothetical protein [Pseudorhizobium pelagicum]|uniref:Uncharacterized protein n=1 Tax=Pseudorhizobium pelagicum TaxID=1509405 RepID=A0A922T7T8_9HYPH|nr:hypothetical protein [Pseudorhizobium pelagicum]KEQ07509.1 hypothetical protein GV67_22405 [Pseudorhizobium pelagicum]KEQ09107.1 hypothetical protein GV68_25425 [Pseudorhizobium pelagicum]
MKILDGDSLTVDFSEEPIAQPTPSNCYCVFADAPGELQRMEILVRKSAAHRVAQAAIALELEWRLIFDEEDGAFIILELTEPTESLSPLADALDALGFRRVTIPYAKIENRRLHIPQARKASSAPA